MNGTVFYRDIILKSCNIDEYSDLIVKCKVIENEEIGNYLSLVKDDNKFIARKVAPVMIRKGFVGEKVNTVLTIERDGRRYNLFEQSNVVKQRDCGVNGVLSDIVICNFSSDSGEEYVVRPDNFLKAYSLNDDGTYSPISGFRELVLIDEDIMIKTSWGTWAVCLAGSYIVVYDSMRNDYNVLERSAMEKTYKKEINLVRKR